ncbi:unnamed protein product, partial [Prorocentrum cordatum]
AAAALHAHAHPACFQEAAVPGAGVPGLLAAQGGGLEVLPALPPASTKEARLAEDAARQVPAELSRRCLPVRPLPQPRSTQATPSLLRPILPLCSRTYTDEECPWKLEDGQRLRKTAEAPEAEPSAEETAAASPEQQGEEAEDAEEAEAPEVAEACAGGPGPLAALGARGAIAARAAQGARCSRRPPTGGCRALQGARRGRAFL